MVLKATQNNKIAALRCEMPRGPCVFKQRDVTRAAKAVLAAGLEIDRVEITKDGAIVVVPGKQLQTEGGSIAERNEWDSLS